MILPRRQFLTGLASLIAAPAVVRASSLMPVKPIYTGLQAALLDAVTQTGITLATFHEGRFWWVERTSPQIIRWTDVSDPTTFIPPVLA